MGARVGTSVTVRLGDGATLTATVVALYGRGLGFGDVTLANDVVRAHTSTGLDDSLLVASDAAHRDEVTRQIASWGLVVQDRDSLAAAGSAERDAQSWVNVIALLVVLGYVALAVVNTLSMATAARRPEFTLLHLIGSTGRQIRLMMRVEAVLVVTIAVVVGTLIAIPPLVGVAVGLSGRPLPTVPTLTYLAIIGSTVIVGMASIAVPTRTALRRAA